MKKSIVLVLIITAGLVKTVSAQSLTDTRERFTAGIKAGANYANVWDAQGEEFDADPKFGFAGGVFASIPIGMYFGIQPEVLISQKGFQASGRILGNDYSFKRTKTYLDIPLQVQIKPIEYITIVAGPQIGFQIHEKNSYTFGENSVEQEEEFENENVRKNMLGFVAGLDINISHIVISGRVGWDFQNNNGDGTSTTPRYKNQWIQMTVGIKI